MQSASPLSVFGAFARAGLCMLCMYVLVCACRCLSAIGRACLCLCCLSVLARAWLCFYVLVWACICLAVLVCACLCLSVLGGSLNPGQKWSSQDKALRTKWTFLSGSWETSFQGGQNGVSEPWSKMVIPRQSFAYKVDVLVRILWDLLSGGSKWGL